MKLTTADIRLQEIKPLISPALLIDQLPITENISQLVDQTRQSIAHILNGEDDRLLVVVGPCSIHDPNAALEYAHKLMTTAERFKEELCIVMRVYFEKPRTTIGWKGLINDPHLDNSFAINQGLQIARKLLLEINALGMPAGTEFLDTTIPQFLSDLISWGAIGARTTESQIHRELASGLSMPIGFKNGTSGNVQIAIDAIRAVRNPHHFLGITQHGMAAIVSTLGNPNCHVILRGSSEAPNYDAASTGFTAKALEKAQLPASIMVDCSHGNSQKNHLHQIEVAQNLCAQMSAGAKAICGVMIESHLHEGRQDMVEGKPLTYGQSVTDACISWQQTVPVLENFAKAVQQRRYVSNR